MAVYGEDAVFVWFREKNRGWRSELRDGSKLLVVGRNERRKMVRKKGLRWVRCIVPGSEEEGCYGGGRISLWGFRGGVWGRRGFLVVWQWMKDDGAEGRRRVVVWRLKVINDERDDGEGLWRRECELAWGSRSAKSEEFPPFFLVCNHVSRALKMRFLLLCSIS